MKSFSALSTLYGKLTNDTGDLALGNQLINDSIRAIGQIRGGTWPWLEVTKTQSTVASQATYQIQNSIRKVIDLYITVGGNVCRPIAIHDPERWKVILSAQFGNSDIPLFYYVQGKTVTFAPTPASNGNTITIRGRLRIRDLSIADYIAGTIVSVANGGTAVVGSGTTWTADMAGRFIQITEADLANKGDGFWYEIASVTNATNLVLTKPYEGVAIAAGAAAYTIGQMSAIPEAYDIAPIYRAVAIYWQQQNNPTLAASYWRMYDGGHEAGLIPKLRGRIAEVGYGGIIGQMLEDETETTESAYISPKSEIMSNLGVIDPNNPPSTVSNASFT